MVRKETSGYLQEHSLQEGGMVAGVALHSFGPAPAKIITWDHYALDFNVSFTSLSAGAALEAEKHNLLEVIISFMFSGVMCLLPEPFQIKCKLSVCATLNVFRIKEITLK